MMLSSVAGLPGCGHSQDGQLALQVRFASQGQAQEDAGGLPLGVGSFRLEVRSGSAEGTLLVQTDCVDVKVDARERHFFQLDLEPLVGMVLIVNGYGNSICLGKPEWMGLATGVRVTEGDETRVPIYVTRRGMRLNDTRAALPRTRAFATATALPDGKVLIAGGFDSWHSSDALTIMEAACGGLIYDPQTATLGKPIPLSAGCRGLHSAVTLSDGRVLLVGGTRLASIRLNDGLQILPVANDILSSADLFDPDTGTFSPVGPLAEFRRADMATVVLDDDTVVLLGGRAEAGKSRDIVVGTYQGDSSWEWAVAGRLATERSGLLCVPLEAGIFCAGGAEYGVEEPAELVSDRTFTPLPIDPPIAAYQLHGHSLLAAPSDRVLLAGGRSTFPGAAPSATVLQIKFNGAIPVVTESSLTLPRAFHTAALLPDGKMLVAGGMDSTHQSTRDIEVVGLPDGGESLQDWLGTGAVGIAQAPLPDGSILLAGGLDVEADTATFSEVIQLLSP